MKKILENQHEQRIIVENNALEDERLTATLQTELGKGQCPYSRQWKSWYLAAVFFGFIGGALSLITEVLAFAWLTYFEPLPASVALLLAGAVGVLLAGLVEWLKRGANDSFFFGLVFRRKFDGYNFVKMLFIMAISISTSFYACTLIPKASAKITAAGVELIKVDSIKSSYEQRISTLSASMESVRSNAKSWNAGVAAVSEQQKTLDKLYAAQDTATAKAETENTRRLRQSVAETTDWGWTLGFFSVALEVLFMLAFWYSKNYLYKSALERGMIEDAEAEQEIPTESVITERVITQPVPPIIKDADQAPVARKPIGFEMPTVKIPIINEATTQPVNTQSVNMPQCHNCNDTYTKNAAHQRFCKNACREEWHTKNGTDVNGIKMTKSRKKN